MSTTPNGTPDSAPVTRAELRTELSAIEMRMLERMEKVETHLLTEFRVWARRSDTRVKANTILINSFDERLGDLENQVADLRDKLE
ncbi:MAG: hypothetical protein ACRD3Y_01520 [Bryobacteraceae bacterium]